MTQEYTPTTEEIRADYSGPAGGSSAQIAYYYTRTLQFKRWLADHDARIRAEALTLTEDEQKLVIDALYSESYRDKVCSANTITDYDERQAEFRRINNELSLGLFPMIAKHRKEQQQ